MYITIEFLKDFLRADSEAQEKMLTLIGDSEAEELIMQLELEVLQEQLSNFKSEKFKGYVSAAIEAY